MFVHRLDCTVRPGVSVKLPKARIKTPISFNGYSIISRAVEEGVAYGYRRAYKHTDTPTEEQMTTEIENAVMNEICEVLNFGEDE